MSLSLGHLLVVLVLVFVLFGAGKLPRVMGDLGKGIRNLREGMGNGESAPTTTPEQEVLPPLKKKKTTTVKKK